MFHDSAKGTQANVVIYSISETAKLNNLETVLLFKYLLTELPKLCDDKGNIDPTKLKSMLPWVAEISKECRKPCH